MHLNVYRFRNEKCSTEFATCGTHTHTQNLGWHFNNVLINSTFILPYKYIQTNTFFLLLTSSTPVSFSFNKRTIETVPLERPSLIRYRGTQCPIPHHQCHCKRSEKRRARLSTNREPVFQLLWKRSLLSIHVLCVRVCLSTLDTFGVHEFGRSDDS